MHIVDTVFFWARSRPQHRAIVQLDLTLTYQQLGNAIEVAAAYFARCALDRSQPVAVAVFNPAKMLIACLGLMRGGFSIIPANQALLEHLPSTGASAMIGERNGPTLNGGTNLLFDDGWLSAAATQRLPHGSRKSPNVNSILFAPGATGKPIPMVQTQAAWDQRILFSKDTAFANFERALIVSDIASAEGFNQSCEVLCAGKAVCFAHFGEPALWFINNYDIDIVFASARQALALADIQEKGTHYGLRDLKTVRVDGAALAPNDMQRIKRNLCRNVIISYGSVEVGPVAIANYDMIANVPNAVGFVTPEAEVEIVNQNGAILPPGAEGFVRLRTPLFAAIRDAAITGSNPDARYAWHYPGDLGRITEEGILCISGQSSNVNSRNGMSFSSEEVEEYLRSCRGVKDAGACRVKGVFGFDEAWVAVVFDSLIDIAAFQSQLQSNDKFGRNINKLFVVEEIPRDQVGKIQRALLNELFQAIDEESRAGV
jgi:acyl-coenzyme A synthetase/AMP-(fatty) acid ligase